MDFQFKTECLYGRYGRREGWFFGQVLAAARDDNLEAQKVALERRPAFRRPGCAWLFYIVLL